MPAKNVLISSIIGFVGYAIGAISMFLMEGAKINLGAMGMILVLIAILAVFGTYFVNLFLISIDAKKRGISQGAIFLGFFLGHLGGIIYYFISKNYEA